MQGQIIINIMVIIYKDYNAAVDTLMESINIWVQEVAILKANATRPATPIPVPIPPAIHKVSAIVTK